MIYDRIKHLCKLNGISVNKLEKELGISKGYLSKIDNVKPSNERLNKIASYFNVSLEYLTTGEEKSTENAYYFNEETAKVAQEIFENKELRALFDATRDSDPEDLRALHNMALALKRKERGSDDDTGC